MNIPQWRWLKPLKRAVRATVKVCWDRPFYDPGIVHYRQYAKGRVLNAGSGIRDIRMGDQIINTDLAAFKKPDVAADLHHLPFKDNTFDTILNIAVLEHIPNSWRCINEFRRVLKPGGTVICSVPFLQPVHDDPGDFIRFSEEGLVRLFNERGFEVRHTESDLNFFHTWGWITYELLISRTYLRWMTVFANPLILLLQRLPIDVPACRSANTVIAVKITQRKPICPKEMTPATAVG